MAETYHDSDEQTESNDPQRLHHYLRAKNCIAYTHKYAEAHKNSNSPAILYSKLYNSNPGTKKNKWQTEKKYGRRCYRSQQLYVDPIKQYTDLSLILVGLDC